MEANGQLHFPAALSLEKKSRYPLDRRLSGPRAGLDVTEKRKKFASAGI
jgi:hypothetical protein